MKFLLDFFPIVLFVGVYALYDDPKPIYPAVMALMVATVIQNIGTRLLTGKFEKMHLWTLGITLVFGTMTLVFRNPAFIFWKASIVVWIMALVFAYRQIFLKKVVIEEMLNKTMEEKIDAPHAIWTNINVVWIVTYTLFGFLNLYIAYNFSEAFWVNFKLFGLMGLNVVLLIYAMVKIYPYMPLEDSGASLKNNGDKAIDAPANSSEAALDKTKED